MDIVKLETEIKKNNETFCDEVRGFTMSQMKDVLARESIRAQEISHTKSECEELNDAKALVKEISQPFNQALKIQKQKIEFIVKIMEEKNIPE